MNARRDLVAHPETTVRAGQINAMGLIDEILHQLIEEYRKQIDPTILEKALAWVCQQFSEDEVDKSLLVFADQFPPLSVYKGLNTPDEYLKGYSLRLDGRQVSNRELLLEEMLMLWLSNENPAFSPFKELFDDRELREKTIYSKILPELHTFFEAQPKFGPENESLLNMLLAPSRLHPDSLSAQLEFMRTRWGGFISIILVRLLSSLDLIREEEKPVFGVGGQPEIIVYDFKGPEYEIEPERFSQDVFWMPNLVLMAKNSYVWLDQLSRKYHMPINHLDQVPDEELEMLARWGITGLWLIGLWERSRASQTIKQLRGNQDAVASAYSLFSYDIAADLGGEQAFQVLREKAWKRGIRLASDMVPNHMGIDSRWVIEHPDWFIQLDYPPFPAYTFNGPDLSWDERVGIQIEDHYFDNSDAAVVFKRTDRWTGQERYVYHGNDGTSMPWNDTAQLNYLLPEVREAVIQTILHVARKFPIIRFDAAMTLAKRHYQRLWFPEPGSGGDIPSRAEHGLSKYHFDQAFPEEFWRSVVDRVAQEAPDTLLLAEAFWLMEGYFVRTLGMHRVYNSAFMNMLRDEKNQEYRLAIKNTIEFDPEILKRYVNFMNNPDERTALDQFGNGDKYFGACTLLATLPGLPMIGHGQIEGFAEKYGMEFRYPKWHEQADTVLVGRHEREIFPLLHRRYIFAEAVNFRLYDFFTPEGFVNEDVFAYSNQAGNQRGLIIYHNRYAETRGWIRMSAAYLLKSSGGEDKVLSQTTLSEALGIHDEADHYIIFRENISGLEYIRQSSKISQEGLYIELKAYQCLVFLDFREVKDDESKNLAHIYAYLDGKGVASVMDASHELELRSILEPFKELVNPGMIQWIIRNRADSESFDPVTFSTALAELDQKTNLLLEAISLFTESDGDQKIIVDAVHADIESLLLIPNFFTIVPDESEAGLDLAQKYLLSGLDGNIGLGGGAPQIWGPLFCDLIIARLGEVTGHRENCLDQSKMDR